MLDSDLPRAQTALRRQLEQRVQSFMERHSLWPESGVVLLAVSGGQDSSALLLILERLVLRRPESIAVAYFDHGLRGKAAASREAEFVARLCADRGVRLVCGAGDVQARAKKEHLSSEDAARRERYEFLGRVANDLGAAHVATGHTASDQAETVLLNITRGAGLDGLTGMRPKAEWPVNVAAPPDLNLVRPLLAISRDETLAYCAASGVDPLADESNLSPAFRRNRVRHELLPLLESFNPRIERALVRLAESAGEDRELLETMAAAAVERADGEASIAQAWFRAAVPSVRRRAVRFAFRAVTGDLIDFNSRHVQAIERLVMKSQTGDSLDLPRGVTASLSGSALILRHEAEPAPGLPDVEIALPVPGEAAFGGLVLAASSNAAPEAAHSIEVDCETVSTGLVVRRRRDGDRFQPNGMTQTKKLHDFLIDSHIPRGLRDAIPLFVSERGIVWVGGLRVAEWAKPRPGRPTIHLSYEAID